ncbi:MAG TPA: VWA domain-containing protein [Ilumatobacter sp.]|nr:VWA domain-containing protein [Ilumatobacter sp.]
MNARIPIVAAALCVAVTACGTADVASPGTTDGGPASTSTTTPSTTPSAGGWIGGEPDWTMVAAEGELLAAAPMSAAADGAVAEMAAEATAAPAGTGPVAPTVPGQPPIEGTLRAGSVDDNLGFDDYLAYRARIAGLGIPLRGGDPSGRVVVSVTGADGHPVHGAVVSVSDGSGSEVAALTTTADGTARFLPAMWSQPVDGTWTFAVAGATVSASAGSTADLTIDQPGAVEAPVALDVLFLLDATGSMSDEIDRLKTSIDSVAARVAALEGSPDVRLAMTVYRDEGDAFVTRTYDFTSDVDAFRAALAEVVADGGGDYHEALDEAFAEAVDAPSWRDPATTLQLMFLVADAPPHVERQVTGYDLTIGSAVSRGIKVFPVASSESDDQAEAVFRQIAQATGARFVFLSYGAGGAATGPSTDIDSTDYEELALDDLVVRLIAEEVAALTGDAGVVPPPTPTTTTIPPQQ